MKNKIILIASCILFNLSSITFALAVDVAPHISDREIVENLVTLKVGQAALGKRIDDMSQSMKAGQAALGKRIDDMSQSIKASQAALHSEMKAGQAALGKRIDDMSQSMKASQAALHSEMKAGQAALGKRIDDMNQSMKAGQNALRSEMKAGQAALGKRMDDMNQRMSSQQRTMLALFSTMVALILALFAYIAWDRRTMIKPVIERVEHLENEVLRELDLSHNKGSAITRLIKAMRELARQDEKVANAMRNFSLL